LDPHTPLEALLKKARRRLLAQLILDKAALALAIVMGGAILLLIAGTQILDWYWLVLLGVAGFGTGLYQLRNGVPSLYRLAQTIDRRLNLADSLSTALHFRAHPDPQREAICRLQGRDAEQTAQGVDVRIALPFQRSRYLLPAACLALAAMGLFGVRYAFTGKLDLNSSLLAIAIDTFFGPSPEIAKNQPRRGVIGQEPFNPGAPDTAANPEDTVPDSLLESADAPDANPGPGDTAKQSSETDPTNKADNQGDQQGKQDENEGAQPQEGQDKNSDNAKQDGKSGQPKNDSMFSKLRDALANMMNRMKQDASQGAQNSKGQQSNPQDAQKEQSQNSGASPSPTSGQQGEQADNQQGDAKGGDRPPTKSSEDSSSSAGNKDGEKALRDAAALQAMGKISELIGKRSANLTGEIMVEVGSTKQQLKTPWLTREANHTEAGSEIHRDEVPLMYQQFVEQYFEEIRKSAPPASGAGKAPAKRAAKTPGKAG
jgi:hypothetical protein